DGKQIQKGDEKTVSIETWGATRFDKEGRAVVQDLGGVSESRVFLVWTGTRQNAKPVFDASFLPTTKDDKSRLSHIAIDAADELAAELSQAIERAGVSVILVHEGEEPRFDTDRLSEVSKAIDSRGFLEKNIVTITMSEMSELRFHKPESTRPTKQTMPLETRIWSDWVPNEKSRLHLSLRPVLEQAMVVRVKPPVRVVSHTDARLTPPAPIHANAPQWRAHIAGTRGNQLGVVSQVLLSAAKQMGYETRVQTNTMIIGPGQRAWAQLLFTRPQTQRTERPLVGFIPWGEADLLLGWDQDESVRAIDPDGVLQVGSSQRTYAILNTGAVEQQTKTPSSMLGDQFIAGGQSPFLKKELGMVADFSAWARYRFHNTRLGDLVQLGVAFQQGLVPVTVDAMNTALREAEKEGFARSLEAFEYGRRIALHPEAAWLPVDEDQTVDLKRLIRRYVRNIRRVGLRGKKRSLVAKKLFDRVIKEMPGLSDSIEGRESLYSAIVCVRRCLLWGGEHTATQYVDSIVNVYKSDRVETRRKLTRSCVLLLAEAVLVPDPIYLARLARSPEIIRNLRQRLNVRKPRGDELHRRFLSRFELSVGKWRLRADIRTSDWSSALISNIGRIIPHRFRGRRRDREIRSLLMQATRIAAANPTSNQLWVKKFDSILEKSEGKTIQSMSVGTLREIIEGEMGYS
ncbi:MAG: hypothetical protein QGI78_08870, partial [Phycisphaerales bacterium]|nr:hypothetical protein [Phycisphaerales bacterium]